MDNILNQRTDTFEKLPPLPPGQYVTMVAAYEPKEVGRNQTPAVVFTLKGFTPAGHIPPSYFERCGDLTTREMPYTLYLTEASRWRVREFLDQLGIEEGDRTLSERLSEAVGKPIMVTITHELGKGQNAGTTFANVSETFKA
jgi:hypothetical protein